MSYDFILETSNKLRNKITKQQQREISALYAQLYLDTKKQIKALNLKNTASAFVQQQRLSQLQQSLKAALFQSESKFNSTIEANMERIADSVAREIDRLVQKLGMPVGARLAHVPKDIVNNVVTGKLYKGNWTLSSAIWKDIQKSQSDINKIVANGIAANKSAYDIAKDLESYVDPKSVKSWEWSKVYPGTKRVIDYNAQRLARTMVSHAYQQSVQYQAENNPFCQGIKWRSALAHGRTCELCRERNGKVYKPNKLPLDHPNGICTFITVLDDLDAIGDKIAAWTKGDPDKQLDKYSEFLKDS